MTLAGQKIVVIGGSSGMGLATARAAALDGAEVTIASSRQDRVDAALAICRPAVPAPPWTSETKHR